MGLPWEWSTPLIPHQRQLATRVILTMQVLAPRQWVQTWISEVTLLVTILL